MTKLNSSFMIGNVEIPQAIEEIRSAKVLHDTVCEVEEMASTVKKILGIE